MNQGVRLWPITPDAEVLLRQVTVSDGQALFSGQPADVLDLVRPEIDVHVIYWGDRVAGMFRIDRDYHVNHDFAAPDTIGLRTFVVDQHLQGRGIASAACRQLREYLRDHYKAAMAAYLTVNMRNTVARRVYLQGGFIDTDRTYLGGGAGPQHILKLILNP